MSRELINFHRALGELIKAQGMAGLGENFADPRPHAFESTPFPIQGNVITPLVSADGCVIDPELNNKQCETEKLQRKRGWIPPAQPKARSRPWVQTTVGGTVSVASGGSGGGGGATTLVTLSVPDGYIGKLVAFGYDVETHATNYAAITIRMSVSEQMEPAISLNPFYKETFQHPSYVYLEIPPGKTLTISAFNSSVGALLVGARAFGFLEPYYNG